jgi:DNA modification methylase
MANEIQKIEWRTERRKVDDLIPHEANPRTITPEQKEKLRASLEKFGLVELPAINADGKIVAGHQRCAVLKLLGRGQEEIEVRVPSRMLTPEEFDQYLLTSNRVAGEWDWGKLLGFDKDLLWASGFDSKEIDKIFSKMEIAEDEFDAELEHAKIVEPIARPGDLFEIGEHRILCGDATNPDDAAKLMLGNKASLVFTDPPYNVNYQGAMNTHSQSKREGIENDDMSEEQFAEFMRKALRVMMANASGIFYICMSSKELWSLKKIFETEGGHWQSFIIWVKNTFTLSRSDWQNKYEPILYGWNAKTKNHYYAGWRNESNVWDGLDSLKPDYDGKTTRIKLGDYHLELDGAVTGRVISKKNQVDIWEEKKPSRSKDHPTMKPLKLIARALTASSTRGQIVSDFFAGSFSTLIAAHDLERKFYGMELDPKYVDVGIKRILKTAPGLEVFRNGAPIDKTLWLKE